MAVALYFLLEGLIALAIAILSTPIFKALVNWLNHPLHWYTKPLDWLINKAIDGVIHFTHWLAPYFESNLNIIVNWFHHSGENSKYTHGAIKNTAAESASTFWWLAHTYIPRITRAQAATTTSTTLVKVRTQPLTKAQVSTFESTIEAHVTKAIAAEIPGIIAKPFPQINWDAKHWRKWLFPGLLAGGLAIPGSTTGGAVGGFTGTGSRVGTKPGAHTWEGTKWREQDRINSKANHRFRTLNWILAFSGAAALVAAGLAKLGLGWMSRCKNLKNIGPAFCGADLSSLISLFGGLALIEGNFSIVELAEEMLAIEKDVVKVIGGAFSELNGLV